MPGSDLNRSNNAIANLRYLTPRAADSWCFCFDTEAGEPEHIEGEEWRDVVMAPAAAGAAQ